MIPKLKADILVVFIVLATALLFFIIPYITGTGQTSCLVIIREGKEREVYPLMQDQTFTVRDENGGYNLILVEGGAVRVSDADCPDKLCVKQKQISRNGESIICLPHKMVVQVVSKEESGLDAMTN